VGLRTLLGLKRRRKSQRDPASALDLDALPSMLGRPDPLILEIGANDGRHSLRFLELFPQARLYCFEPDTRAIHDWRARMAKTHAHLIETAVGGYDGVCTFHVSSGKQPGAARPSEWHQSGSIHKPTEHLRKYPWVRFETTALVPITTLDTWAAKAGIGRVDFIWADVQGAEGDLVEGAQKTLGRTRFLYTEFSDRQLYETQWSLSQIEERLAGFKLIVRYPNDALFVNLALS